MAVNHPAPEVITQFAQGRLPIQEAARWEQHFLGCAECGSKLAQVGSDQFIELLKPASVLDDAASTIDSMAQFPELPAELRHHSRYAIQKRLGQGGMGTVYHAMHRLMNRPVALKMIRGDLLATPVAVTRFRREVQAAAHLHHANIVTAFDAEEVSGVHFLVMEYVEGKSLDQIVHQKGPLAVPLACGIARQIAQGLHHAHGQGMIHRDIKPNNVMLTRQGKVKILDFGLARWSGRSDEKTLPQITRAGSHLGTLMYASPEQRQSAGDVDARADLYSLGATLVFLLTGKPPPLQTAAGTTEELVLPPEVSTDLKAVIARLLMPLPQDRYPNARSVVDALAPHAGTGTIAPVSSPQTRKLRYALLGLSALVLVLMGLLIENYTRNRPDFIARQPTVPEEANPTNPITPQPNVGTKTNPTSWQSLLPLINTDRDSVAGNWRLAKEGLAVGPVQGGRITIPIQVPEEYDLRLIFTRKTGRYSVGAVLVHGGNQCTFELDAWEEHLAGFQNIDGRSFQENPTRRDNMQLENDRRYTLIIEVRANSVRALLDNQEVALYRGDGKNLSVDSRYWAMPRSDTLGLLSWNSWTIFHSVEMRAVKR